jgi:hypothetical protein
VRYREQRGGRTRALRYAPRSDPHPTRAIGSSRWCTAKVYSEMPTRRLLRDVSDLLDGKRFALDAVRLR